MITVISYANDNYKSAQNYNKRTALHFGADIVKAFEPKDIDEEFFGENKHILSQGKGNGYWLWKPYFIDKELSNLQDGDWLIYSDAGMYFNKDISKYLSKFDEDESEFIIQPSKFREREYCKKVVFEQLECYTDEMLESNQLSAGVIIIRCNDVTKNIVRRWLMLAKNPLLISDEILGENQEGFIAHRHDQSILSPLLKTSRVQIVKANDLYKDIMFPNHRRALLTYHHSNEGNIIRMYIKGFARMYRILFGVLK